MPQSIVEPKDNTASAVDTALRDEWLAALNRLVTDVTLWISELPGWNVTREPDKEISEERLGVYAAPVLRILSNDPEAQLILEPMARMTRSGRGRVDLYAWPALYRVRLLNDGVALSWDVLTDSGITLHQNWNDANFQRLAKDLVGA